MRVTVDTNSLIRFFTRDIEGKAQKVKKLLESQPDVFIPDVVFPELEYILLKAYGINRKDLTLYYKFLISNNNIKTTPEVKKAVEIFQNSTLDMADCIIAAQSSKGLLASFDKDLLKTPTIKPFWKD
jgi:predicted nucleic-acid-binding protein